MDTMKKPAGNAKPEDLNSITFGNLFKMIRVEGGTFMMGASGKCSEDSREDEVPVHEVTLSDYYIGEFPVTRALWHKVMGGEVPREGSIPKGKVNWFDCHKFIRKLNKLTDACYYFFLPTEAQWEFAARGGIKSQGYKYAGSDDLDEVAWHSGNSGKVKHPVGQKKPNELGIFDMTGNISEWCEDEWDIYPEEPQVNPEIEPEGANKVFRGGNFSSLSARCRGSNRSNSETMMRSAAIGFRLAMKLVNH